MVVVLVGGGGGGGGVRANYMGTIFIKFKLGITYFAHNYMETSHVASKPKFLKACSGI